METEEQLAKKQHIHQIKADFYTNVLDHALPRFYAKFNNDQLTQEDYDTLVEVTHEHFCKDITIDRAGAAQQFDATPAVAGLNNRAIQKKMTSTSIELGHRTAALMAPDNIELTKAWKTRFDRIGKAKGEYKQDKVDMVYNEMYELGLEKTYYGRFLQKEFILS